MLLFDRDSSEWMALLIGFDLVMNSVLRVILNCFEMIAKSGIDTNEHFKLLRVVFELAF